MRKYWTQENFPTRNMTLKFTQLTALKLVIPCSMSTTTNATWCSKQASKLGVYMDDYKWIYENASLDVVVVAFSSFWLQHSDICQPGVHHPEFRAVRRSKSSDVNQQQFVWDRFAPLPLRCKFIKLMILERVTRRGASVFLDLSICTSIVWAPPYHTKPHCAADSRPEEKSEKILLH